MYISFIVTLIFSLAFCIKNGFCRHHDQFGCRFSSAAFNIKQRNIFDARYGAPLSPMLFERLEDIQYFIDRIKQITKQVLSSAVYDDITEFQEFYRKYRANVAISYPQTNILPQHYYNNYIPEYLPDTVDYTFVINIFNALIAGNQNVAQHVYLCTVYDYIEDDTFQALMSEPTRITNYFSHDHVAGIVKIQFNGTVGHILIDPGSGMVTPIVLINNDNAQSINTDRAITTKRHPFGVTTYFAPLSSESQFLVGQTTIEGHIIKDVYFIGQPFCSFLTSTAKIRLAYSFRSMVKRNENGFPVVSVSFALTIENYHSRNQTFTLNTFSTMLRSMLPHTLKFEKPLLIPLFSQNKFNAVRCQLRMENSLKTMLEDLTTPAYDLQLLIALRAILLAYKTKLKTYLNEQYNFTVTVENPDSNVGVATIARLWNPRWIP